MKAFVVWDGLTEYKAALQQLPEACTGEAAKLVQGGVNAAFLTIGRFYSAHEHTGTLRKRLRIAPLDATKYATGMKLTSGSPIAWLFDNGSKARHYVSQGGALHGTGKMWGKTPPTHIFSGTVGKEKRRLAQLLREMILRHGASTVSEG